MIILAFEVSDVDNFFSSTLAFAGLIEIGHVPRRFHRDQIIEIHLLVLRVRQLFMAKFPRRFSTTLPVTFKPVSRYQSSKQTSDFLIMTSKLSRDRRNNHKDQQLEE